MRPFGAFALPMPRLVAAARPAGGGELPRESLAYEPTAADPRDRRKVAHLYRRAAFGASWAELEEGVHRGPHACIDRLLEGTPAQSISEEDFAAMARTSVAAGSDRNLQGWWVYRMLASGWPLVERVTLFWHDHFATSQDKVANLGLMHAQNELFRRFALGHFWDAETGGLLLAVSRDPAMLIWLDSNSNRRAAPNENFARELMELFALGIGHYTEKDVQEAARGFTGWFENHSRFLFVGSEHDAGEKTVLGRTGKWDGSDVVRIVAEQPAAAVFMVQKLYRYLVNENDAGASERTAPLAAAFRERQFDVRWLVQTMLRSRIFFSAASYRQKISSPVDFTVGTVHRLEGSRVSPVALADVCGRLGQTLFHPPNVAGWDEGKAWINTSTALGRANFAEEIMAARGGRFAARIDPARLAAQYGRKSDADVLAFFLDLLVDGDLPPDTRAKLANSMSAAVDGRGGLSAIGGDTAGEKARRLVQLILTLPEYNLC